VKGISEDSRRDENRCHARRGPWFRCPGTTVEQGQDKAKRKPESRHGGERSHQAGFGRQGGPEGKAVPRPRSPSQQGFSRWPRRQWFMGTTEDGRKEEGGGESDGNGDSGVSAAQSGQRQASAGTEDGKQGKVGRAIERHGRGEGRDSPGGQFPCDGQPRPCRENRQEPPPVAGREQGAGEDENDRAERHAPGGPERLWGVRRARERGEKPGGDERDDGPVERVEPDIAAQPIGEADGCRDGRRRQRKVESKRADMEKGLSCAERQKYGDRRQDGEKHGDRIPSVNGGIWWRLSVQSFLPSPPAAAGGEGGVRGWPCRSAWYASTWTASWWTPSPITTSPPARSGRNMAAIYRRSNTPGPG